MISRLECPLCDTTFLVKQWHCKKDISTTMNASGTKKQWENPDLVLGFEQPDASLNIFHSLFKIIESKNV